MSKAAYIAAADNICTRFVLRAKSVASANPAPDVLGEKIIALGEQLTDQLRALSPPPGDRAMLSQLYSELAAERGEVEKTMAAFRSGDAPLVGKLSAENVATNNKLLDRLSAYGITTCRG